MLAQSAVAQAAKQAVVWEVRVENDYSSSIDIAIYEGNDPTAEYSSTISSSGAEEYSFTGGTGADWDGTHQTKYRFEIEVGVTTYEYLYVGCDHSKSISGMEFYCPNAASSPHADITLIANSSGVMELEIVGLNPSPGASDAISHFSDDNWVFPYNLDTYCDGATGACDEGSTSWFLTPQTSLDTYTFSSEDMVQPSDESWYFDNGVTVTFPANKTLTINKALEIDDDTDLRFADDSALIYDGDDNAFDIPSGATVKLGDDVRLTFESKIKLTGASGAGNEITFSPLGAGDQWDYFDLKADGNDFDFVVFDGGYKTVEIRSDNNTFDNVTFENGWRGVSSYSHTGGGRSSFQLNDCTVSDNSGVGVVAYNTDFGMDDCTVEDNGEAGVWLTNAETTDGFTNNTITNNAATASTRAGLEVNAGGELDAWDSAYNTIKNNPHNEVKTTSSAQANLGLVILTDPGGAKLYL